MEDGVKEETHEKPKCPITVDKAGWLKKSSGGLLSLWKERYIQLCKSQLLMYENEEEQKCAETVELEKYDRCQDLRALLKRRNRFILIRAPGYKAQDIKFQASNGEEKESWMKALNEGISRGKNRILDEVKVDESLSLEHVTRKRAKVAQVRRPPTRSHLKEVASAMSDGILRLDLDVPDSSPPNVTMAVSEAAEAPPPKETPKPPMPPIKPPMPPTKESTSASIPEGIDVKTPPVPPAKLRKEAGTPGENVNSKKEEESEDDTEVSDEVAEASKPGSKIPPMPPAKPPKQGAAVNENTKSIIEEDQGEEEDVAVGGDDGDISKVTLDGEDLLEVSRYPPVLPLKILSDKVTVTWNGPNSEEQDVESAEPSRSNSKEELQEGGQAMARAPTPPPKIISDRLRGSMDPQRSSLEGDTCEGHSQHEDMEPPLNGFGGSGRAEPVSQNGEEVVPFQEHGANEESLPSKKQLFMPGLVGNSPATKPRCASVGNLLSTPTEEPLQWPDGQRGAALHVARMEKKVAREQERTEELLQKVLHRGHEQTQEVNAPAINAETLLNEAAKQLRQATQVLKEVRDLGELNKEPTERQKGASKDLVTLYRRSAP